MSNKNTNKVDKIRDLIFGNQIKDFEAKFEQIDETMHTLEEKITKALNESHHRLEKQTARSLEILETKIDKLSSSTHKERTKLKEHIDMTDKNLQDQLDEQSDKFVTKLKIIKENIAHDNEKMSEEMRVMQREIQATVERNLSSLSNEKLSKDSMAQMLLDVAMKIQDKDDTKVLIKGKKSGK